MRRHDAAERSRVVAEALAWLETPYHHHGRVRGVGVDCAQLLCAVFEGAGIVPRVDVGHYAHDWHLHRSDELFIGHLGKFARRMPEGTAPLPGDVAVWRFGRCFAHGSILVEPGCVVHAYIGRGVIRTRLSEEPLTGRPVQWWTMW